MQAFLTLTRRELSSFLGSLTGYVIIGAAALQMGLSFSILLWKLADISTATPITELFYISPFFWLIVLLSTPIITMRLFALEKYSGTFETLMTTPVGDLQVVLAKFTGALIFYMVMWLPLAGCLALFHHYTNDPSSIDLGAIGTTYLGIFLVGCLYTSIGCLGSSLTKSQITASMITLAIGMALFLLSFLGERAPNEVTWLTQTLNHINMIDHMQDFSRGIVDTRWVSYYVSLTGLFLFLTYRVVESRRWK